MYRTTVKYHSEEYPSVEHAYVAAMARYFFLYDIADKLVSHASPFTVKALGKQLIKQRPELRGRLEREFYPNPAYTIMKHLIREKCRNHTLRQQHIDTDEAYLAEATRDKRWAVGKDKSTLQLTPYPHPDSTNWLGSILMQVRHEIRSTTPRD